MAIEVPFGGVGTAGVPTFNQRFVDVVRGKRTMVWTVKALFSVAVVCGLSCALPSGAAHAVHGDAVEPTHPAGDVVTGHSGTFVAGPILTAGAVMFVVLLVLFLSARFVIRRRIQRRMAGRA